MLLEAVRADVNPQAVGMAARLAGEIVSYDHRFIRLEPGRAPFPAVGPPARDDLSRLFLILRA